MLLLFAFACVPDVLFGYSRDGLRATVADPTYENDILPIWQDKCRFCHLDGAARGGLDLTRPGEALVGSSSNQVPGMALITAGSPEESYLLAKLEGTFIDVGGTGSPMPIGAGLDPADLATIRAWITDGAPSAGAIEPGANFVDDIDPVFKVSCSGGACHTGAAATGLDLDAGYAALIDVTSAEDPSYVLLKRGSAEDSYLYLKLAGLAGTQMPLARDPLSDAAIEGIEAWINDGAPETAADVSDDTGGTR